MDRLYLDHNATTPTAPEVVDAMLPYLGTNFGNAGSVHSFGRDAKVALETAREEIASLVNADPSEIYFTSGGTESDNIAVYGTTLRLAKRRPHLIVGAAEHHAVLEPAEHLQKKHGLELDLLPVDRQCFSSVETLRRLLRDSTSLVSVMHANNEVGTVQDIAAMAQAAHERGALFHTDAVQTVGKLPIDVKAMDLDLMSFTAHKIYGPKGIGALFVRSGVKVDPLMLGGAQEKGRRPGTSNVAGAVGFAAALRLAARCCADDARRIGRLANNLMDQVTARIPETVIHSPRDHRLPQTVNLSFVGVEGEPVILQLDLEGIAISSGSACTSGATEPSHVLAAMGVERAVALGALRISLGRSTAEADVDRLLHVLPPIVERLRAMTSGTAGVR